MGVDPFVTLRLKSDATLFGLDVKLRSSPCSMRSIKHALQRSRRSLKTIERAPATHRYPAYGNRAANRSLMARKVPVREDLFGAFLRVSKRSSVMVF